MATGMPSVEVIGQPLSALAAQSGQLAVKVGDQDGHQAHQESNQDTDAVQALAAGVLDKHRADDVLGDHCAVHVVESRDRTHGGRQDPGDQHSLQALGQEPQADKDIGSLAGLGEPESLGHVFTQFRKEHPAGHAGSDPDKRAYKAEDGPGAGDLGRLALIHCREIALGSAA